MGPGGTPEEEELFWSDRFKEKKPSTWWRDCGPVKKSGVSTKHFCTCVKRTLFLKKDAAMVTTHHESEWSTTR